MVILVESTIDSLLSVGNITEAGLSVGNITEAGPFMARVSVQE